MSSSKAEGDGPAGRSATDRVRIGQSSRFEKGPPAGRRAIAVDDDGSCERVGPSEAFSVAPYGEFWPCGSDNAEGQFPERRLLRLQKQLANHKLLIIDELGFVPLSKTSAELHFELISQRYERDATLITGDLPFDEWTEV